MQSNIILEEGEIANKMSTPFAGRGRESYRRVPAERVSRKDVLNAYGPSMKDAWTVAAMGGNKNFYENRVSDGFYGRGAYKRKKYSGRGMYTGRVEGQGMYSMAAPLAYAAKTGIDYAVQNPRATRKFFKNIGNKFMGRGEYDSAISNELMSNSTLSSPKFASVPDESGSLIVSHREYIGDIFAPASGATSDFTVQSFPLNPGLEQTFPWLSQIAQNYEEYEMIQCVFEFMSTVQDINSANGQVGTIITATQYNPSEPDFRDKPAMAAYAHSATGKSTDPQTHGVECDPSKISGSSGKYIRANPVMTGEDLKTYDHGRFQLATHNIPGAMASGTLGELYVSYTVKLRKPKFFTGRGLGLTRFLTVGDAVYGSGNTNSLPCGTDAGALNGLQNNLAVSVARSADSLSLTIPAYYGGNLTIQIAIEGSGLSGEFSTPSFAGNISSISDMYAAGNASTVSPDYYIRSTQATRSMIEFHVTVEPSTNATDNVITVASSFTGTVKQSSLNITEYNTFNRLGAPQLANSAGTIITI